MDKISTVGLDIAKQLFQVHCKTEAGRVVVRRKLRRAAVLKFFGTLPVCVIGIEACSSAYCWAREIGALGHQVRLMPPVRVKAYVTWGRKNDAADAAAICEAVRRPSMRFVPVKTVEQQAVLMLHQARRLLVPQRTRLCNAVRGHMAELGVTTAKGAAGFTALLRLIAGPPRTSGCWRSPARP